MANWYRLLNVVDLLIVCPFCSQILVMIQWNFWAHQRYILELREMHFMTLWSWISWHHGIPPRILSVFWRSFWCLFTAGISSRRASSLATSPTSLVCSFTVRWFYCQVICFGPWSGPETKSFKRFKESWPQLNHMPKVRPVTLIYAPNEVKGFTTAHLNDDYSRDDNQDLLELCPWTPQGGLGSHLKPQPSKFLLIPMVFIHSVNNFGKFLIQSLKHFIMNKFLNERNCDILWSFRNKLFITLL